MPCGISNERAHSAAGNTAAAGLAMSATGGRDHGPNAFTLGAWQDRSPIEPDRS
jgi:hypothetical protein